MLDLQTIGNSAPYQSHELSRWWLTQALESGVRQHAQRVAVHARALAESLGCPRLLVDAIAVGGLLHDIGKVAVPMQILQKSGPLTDHEWELVRQHPTAGASMAQAARLPEASVYAILCHHERLDGRGYALGLAGDEIPLPGRIVAVADAFDAMVYTRPYQPARTVEDALDELRRCAGSQFDATVVDHFAAHILRYTRGIAHGQQVEQNRSYTGARR